MNKKVIWRNEIRTDGSNTFYEKIQFPDGREFKRGDSVELESGCEIKFTAIIGALFKVNATGEEMCKCIWLFKGEEISHTPPYRPLPSEVFISTDHDINPISTLLRTLTVVSYDRYIGLPREYHQLYQFPQTLTYLPGSETKRGPSVLFYRSVYQGGDGDFKPCERFKLNDEGEVEIAEKPLGEIGERKTLERLPSIRKKYEPSKKSLQTIIKGESPRPLLPVLSFPKKEENQREEIKKVAELDLKEPAKPYVSNASLRGHEAARTPSTSFLAQTTRPERKDDEPLDSRARETTPTTSSLGHERGESPSLPTPSWDWDDPPAKKVQSNECESIPSVDHSSDGLCSREQRQFSQYSCSTSVFRSGSAWGSEMWGAGAYFDLLPSEKSMRHPGGNPNDYKRRDSDDSKYKRRNSEECRSGWWDNGDSRPQKRTRVDDTPISDISDTSFVSIGPITLSSFPDPDGVAYILPDRDMKIQFGISLEKLFSMPFFSCGATFVSVNSESLAKYTSLIKGKQMAAGVPLKNNKTLYLIPSSDVSTNYFSQRITIPSDTEVIGVIDETFFWTM